MLLMNIEFFHNFSCVAYESQVFPQFLLLLLMKVEYFHNCSCCCLWRLISTISPVIYEGWVFPQLLLDSKQGLVILRLMLDPKCWIMRTMCSWIMASERIYSVLETPPPYGGLLSSSSGVLEPLARSEGPSGPKGDFAGRTDEWTTGLRELD